MAKTTTGNQKAVRSKSRRTFAGTPKGFEPRPAFIDYKDTATLKKFMTGQGKLMPRKRSGLLIDDATCTVSSGQTCPIHGATSLHR